jgi:hypothetical protein
MTGYNGAGAEDTGPEVAKSSDQRLRDKARQEAAQHAEIKERYASEWSAQSKPDRIKSVRRGQVLRLLGHRHGATLPDDTAGRAALQLLFELGLDGPTAQTLAPWATDAEIEHLIAAADANWRAWSRHRDGADGPIDKLLIPERVGERLEISFDEYKLLGLSHIRPCDAQRHEVDDCIASRQAERLRTRAQRYRDSNKKDTPASLDPWDLSDERAKALAIMLLGDRQWWSVRQLAEHAQERLGAFHRLTYSAACRAVRRAIHVLEGLGIVVTKTEIEHHGLPVLYVRRPMTAAEREAEALEELAAEQATEQ